MSNQPIHISGVTDSAVVVGTARDVTNAPVTILSNEESVRLKSFMTDLRAAVPSLELSEASRVEIEKQLRVLEAGTKTPPDKERRWLRETMSCIYGILVGVAGNAAYSGLLETARRFMQ